MEEAEELAMVPKAVRERTRVVPGAEGREERAAAWSTILTRMVWLGIQVPGVEALMHLTMYCLPHDAPLSQIPSPAAAIKLFDGNSDESFP